MLCWTDRRKLKRHIAADNERLTQIFEALSDPNRCKLFRAFTKHHDMNVGEVASILEISMPLASQHLKILERNNLLVREKIGREVFYRVNENDTLVTAVKKAMAL